MERHASQSEETMRHAVYVLVCAEFHVLAHPPGLGEVGLATRTHSTVSDAAARRSNSH